MDYKSKYLKYKQKYEILLKEIKGGIILSDYKEGTLQYLVDEHQKKYLSKYNRIFTKPYPNPDMKIDLLEMNKPEYLEIYKLLVNGYLSDTLQKQEIKDKSETIIFSSEEVYPSDYNFTCLIFLSYLLELELFIISNYKYGYNYFNTEENKEYLYNKSCKTTFCESTEVCTLYRIYKYKLQNNISGLLNELTSTLENIFNNFIWSILEKVNYEYNPVELERNIKDRSKGILLELFNNSFRSISNISIIWKKTLVKFMREKFKIVDSDNNIRADINTFMEESIKSLEDDNTKYIAEGTGFFSFIFLSYPKFNQKNNFGSCITYSLLEMYLMSRLHINPNNINLELQGKVQSPRHDTWNYLQDSLKVKSLGHWTTKFTFKSRDIHFRDGRRWDPNYRTVKSYNFIQDKVDLFRIIIYPNLDSYSYYINKKCNYEFKSHILEFIKQRFYLFESIINPQQKYFKNYNKLSILRKNMNNPNLNIILTINDIIKYEIIKIVNNKNFNKILDLNSFNKGEITNYKLLYKKNIYSKEEFNSIYNQIEHADTDIDIDKKISYNGILTNYQSKYMTDLAISMDDVSNKINKMLYIENKKNKLLQFQMYHNMNIPIILSNISKKSKRIIYNISPNIKDKLELETPLNDFVVTKLLRNDFDRSKFLELVIRVFENSIDEWIKEYVTLKHYTHTKYKSEYERLKKVIKFIYKGGLSLRIIFKELIRQFSIDVENLIENKFGKYFKMSDFDFEIIINLPNTSLEYIEITNQLSVLSNSVLEIITNIFNSNDYQNNIFTFFNLSLSTQTKHFNELFKKIKFIINENLNGPYNKKYKYLLNGVSKVNGLLLNKNLKSDESRIDYRKYESYNIYEKKVNYMKNKVVNRIIIPYKGSETYPLLSEKEINIIASNDSLINRVKIDNFISITFDSLKTKTIRDILEINELSSLFIFDLKVFLSEDEDLENLNNNLKLNLGETEVINSYINNISYEEINILYNKMVESRRFNQIDIIKLRNILILLKRKHQIQFDSNLQKLTNDKVNINLNNAKKGMFYCTFNNNLKFGNRIICLSRLKLNFRLFLELKKNTPEYLNSIPDGKNLKCLNLSGEVIDVSIKINDWKKQLFNEDSYAEYMYSDKTKVFKYQSYSLEGQFMDLLSINYKEGISNIEKNFEKPWEDLKYNKRIGRMIFILFLDIFNQKTVNYESMKSNLLKLSKIFDIKTVDEEWKKKVLLNEQINKLNELLSNILEYKVKEEYDKISEIQEYLEIQNNKLALFLRIHLNFMYYFNDKLVNDWKEYISYCNFILTELKKIVDILNYIEKDNLNKNKYTSFYKMSNVGFIN
jgi:hypothetical protein